MKSIFLGLGLLMTTGVMAHAVELKAAETSSDSATGLILLAMVGVVVATGSGIFATRNDNSLDIEADDADDNAGF
jgi:hypothetical protein